MSEERTLVDIEIRPSAWVTLSVTFGERRELLIQADPEQRFVTEDGRIRISRWLEDEA
jgi:hypothetical protein